MSWLRHFRIVAFTLLLCGGAVQSSLTATSPAQTTHRAALPAVAAAAFEAMVPVLRHPRCMNCHSRGDYPRQGDDSHPHTMNVRRGANGQGVAGLQCSTCHQTHNLQGEHMPPGAPGWHLPSAATPLIWEGLTNGQLCELFKNPAQNGHLDLDGIVRHMNTPLVLWGWNPGPGRTPVPMPKAEFLENVKKWASNGATCPAGE